MKAMAIVKKVGIVLGVALVAGQALRPNRVNPPVDPAKTLVATTHPPAEVAAALNRGCRDCHTSETTWPWYTNVTPLSWWIANHVNEGRRKVSFSDWASYDVWAKAEHLGDTCEQVERRDMPMPSYLWIHRDAQLSDGERHAICEWTTAELARMGPLPPMPEGRQGRGRGRGRPRRD